MQVARLTSKGQVTIPKQARQYLNVDTGDNIMFMINPDRTITILNADDDEMCLQYAVRAVKEYRRNNNENNAR